MKKILLAAALLLLLPLAAYSQNVVNYIEQGGARTVIGGALDVVSGGELDIESGGALKIAGTAVLADAAEINRAADVSTRLVSLSGSSAITVAAHDGKTLCIGSDAGTSTLPAATGTGAVYKFVTCAVPPGAGYKIQVTGDDTIAGTFLSTADGGDTVVGFETAADTDTLTFSSSTTGGASIGTSLWLQDIAADQYTIMGIGTSTGSEASPFSAAVAP